MGPDLQMEDKYVHRMVSGSLPIQSVQARWYIPFLWQSSIRWGWQDSVRSPALFWPTHCNAP